MKNRFHKWTHWEYWPAQVVYSLTFFYWLFSAIRFSSIHFYRWANPGIENGGLHGDSKWKIYKMLPAGSYPETVLISSENRSEVLNILGEMEWYFPLIVKPDIGCRGVMVQKVHSQEELLVYMNEMKQDFLIQEECTFPNEMGLFYVKHPLSGTGEITGITIKRFLKVIGNGKDSIESLMKQDFRSHYQIEKLRLKMDLTHVLKNGEERLLVPFGNHNRGTLFLDGKVHITAQLSQTFDRLLRDIEGFNYGRLDIRYNTLEELERGINFSIIELNGAKSEPTHIYDPKHSFVFGQKEIFRHQIMMMRIVAENKRLGAMARRSISNEKSPLLSRN